MNCLDETQSTIYFCDRTGIGVNHSVRIQETNVIFSTFESFMPTVSIRYRQRWAGTRLACRAGEKSHLRVYTRDMFLFFMGLKRQKFSWSLLARHFYTRQLACEPQTGSLAYFLVAVRNGTKENDQFSRSKFYIQQHAACCFCCTSMQGQTVLKVLGNLNKGASGSMKLN